MQCKVESVHLAGKSTVIIITVYSLINRDVGVGAGEGLVLV